MKKLILVLGLVGCTVAPVDAKPEARRWAAEMGYTVKGVSCAGRDSDGDGYVSCSINTETEALAVECNYLFGDGCKLVNPIKVRGGRY